jgi:alkanesulfonate monooxygenase SsuD/methylene tetrahydromethanopterin reductase-like flavin-dependent oxidoreductase (luciferase family)
MTTPLHLAVALDGAGWHPAAWRDPTARPDGLFTAEYWADLVVEAEHGLLDFVTFEDRLGLAGRGDRPDRVQGRLDAVLLAARLAPLTSRIGLVPTTSTTHSEPFHIAIGIASLDFASNGRAGWRPQISPRAPDAAHFGRRSFPDLRVFPDQPAPTDLPASPDQPAPTDVRGRAPGGARSPEAAVFIAELFDEAADVVEVVRRLWDSWEDDAEIRDTATGRFIDIDKLHYIDFEGAYFNVRGPSITPRSPQAQPLVTALAHDVMPYEFAARGADVVYVTPHSHADAATVVGRVRDAEAAVGRRGSALKVFADLVVFVDEDAGAAAARKARLDELDGAELISDAEIFTGTPGELAGLLLDWREAGLDGYRLRPGVFPYDLTGVTRGLAPELHRRGAFRGEYDTGSLRERLGLARPANRYARPS